MRRKIDGVRRHVSRQVCERLADDDEAIRRSGDPASSPEGSGTGEGHAGARSRPRLHIVEAVVRAAAK
jgi:hypothetical protein